MFLKKRCRHSSRKWQFLLLLLMLAFLLVMVTMLNPTTKNLNKEGASLLAKSIPNEGYQVDFGETQEILDALEDSQQYLSMEGLSPFISLREDELLVAIESPTGKRNHTKVKKGYRMVRQQSRKQEEDRQMPDLQSHLVKEDGFQNQTDAGEQAIGGLEMYGFNEALSKQIPLHRKLPEVRHPLCLKQEPSPNLPTASVIICFRDEAWSTLLRTIHSVLDTAPRGFLREIILVDDLSTHEYLKSSLSEYISKLSGVKLIRSSKRLGVIQGRMLGAARATGDVVVFMDSHCECHSGWLEPLLERLASDRRRIVSPVIDVIDWKTFEYYHIMDLQRGVFDWKLDFQWKPLTEHEKKVRLSPISPIRSPAVPGGVIAVHRHYFQNTGGYDSDMTLSGAENLELSIKAWLCGGSVEIIPCSRVGHVYRAEVPYYFPDEEIIERNKIRIAETWLDSFKHIFYKHDRLACLISKLYNSGLGLCMEYKSEKDAVGGLLELSPCSDSINQLFEYNAMKEIRFRSTQQFCFDVRHKEVVLQNCTKVMENSLQHWDIKENGMIVHELSGKCIEAIKTDLCLQKCNKGANQIWQLNPSYPIDER
ncbi:hypothetical protein JD844_002938 [Phrynosoma platyrhinos]|uniref:Polypeptide N-acetylgalactosaminyltransferase n=1 Tax=Phrynosoma platyrhinos TaxID=52577 RepID=A0ABQ7TC78_PHRPL|nr:hypothetical protein JD844_002938 [Phrynosoma platyrhinos]